MRLDRNLKEETIMLGDIQCQIDTLFGYYRDLSNIRVSKKFQVDFCTVAHWQNGQIDEENLFYDQMGMMSQLGLTQ